MYPEHGVTISHIDVTKYDIVWPQNNTYVKLHHHGWNLSYNHPQTLMIKAATRSKTPASEGAAKLLEEYDETYSVMQTSCQQKG